MPGIRTLQALSAVMIIATLLSACGGGDDPTPTSSSNSEPTATATSKPSPAALDGTAWLLAGLNGVDLDLQTPITLEFNDGQASGYSGCNDYSGEYSASESGDFAIPEIARTDMDCETGTDLEAEYLETLGNAEQYAIIEGERLELSDASGDTTLVFSAEPRAALDGTSWIAVEIDGDAPIDGTTPTMTFDDGKVSGSTGCNEYGGTYTTGDEDTIRLSDLFWTERACIQPEGVMEQEQAFLDALENAASYELNAADGLQIADADGRIRLVLTSAELATE